MLLKSLKYLPQQPRTPVTPSSSGVLETQTFMVFDSSGTLVYPLGMNPSTVKLYWDHIHSSASPSGKIELKHDGDKERVSYLHSNYTGWTVAVLQSQMNPHFLYNTITVISVMAEEADHHEIVRTCKLLSKMMRYILDHQYN